jgi:hypothetical protein
MVDAKGYLLLNLLSVRTLQRGEAAHIQGLQEMRGVWRHVERNDQVLRAELIKFGTTVAAVPVKDQESVSADRTRLGMLIEHLLQPEQA